MRELAEIVKDGAFGVDLVTDDFLSVMQSGVRELDAVFLVDGARSSDRSFHGTMLAREGLALFGVVRETKPVVCVDTGVAYGVSSAFLPKAIALNGFGKLYSIDLPSFTGEGGRAPRQRRPHPRRKAAGWLVPDSLRGNWELLDGSIGELLPGLLERLGAIDFFVHDNEHSYECMSLKYEAAIKSLQPGGVLMSHDIYATDAFPDFINRHQLDFDALGMLGVVQAPGDPEQ